jgi:hypothetical protein
MYARQELVELGERVADEGVYRHERELQDLAQAVATRSPGAALVLGDPTAPAVLRERALAVAADVVMSIEQWPQESGHIGDEATVIVQSQLVAQGV